MHKTLRRIIAIGGLLALPLAVYGQSGPPAGYYTAAETLTGSELRAALHDLVNDHHIIPYSSSSRIDVHDALDILDEDPTDTNNVILIYSLRSEAKTNWPAWNREHTWPNSLGADYQEPAYSDLHAIRACDASVNSSRGNKYYDWSDTNSTSYKFPAYAETPLCSTDNNSWEPPDAIKGDLARSQFYMDIRYEGDSDEPDLMLTDHIELISSATNLMGRLTPLILWHLQDPVDDAERLRNDSIYNLFQTNRNPFVDHPEWVLDIFVPPVFIQPVGSALRIRWPATGLNLNLIASPSLHDPWTTVTNTPVEDTEGWFIDLPTDTSNRVFRLQTGN